MIDTQHARMIKAMKKGKVKNHEFVRDMFILSYTKRLSELREKGYNIQKQRIYDRNGKATGVFEYWIAS